MAHRFRGAERSSLRQARIVQLRSGHGKVYNGTVATPLDGLRATRKLLRLLRYDQRVEKWLVELFTGLEAGFVGYLGHKSTRERGSD